MTILMSLLCGVSLLFFFFAVYLISFGIPTDCEDPRSIWRSRLPDAVFNKCMDAHGMGYFYLNGIRGDNFSYFQKRRFFKRVAEAQKKALEKKISKAFKGVR